MVGKKGKSLRKDNGVTIKIPRELYHNLQKIIVNTGFSCVTDFIVFTMREIASMGNAGTKYIPKEQAEAVKEKLRALGYIN